jgi:hypothetical protein
MTTRTDPIGHCRQKLPALGRHASSFFYALCNWLLPSSWIGAGFTREHFDHHVSLMRPSDAQLFLVSFGIFHCWHTRYASSEISGPDAD